MFKNLIFFLAILALASTAFGTALIDPRLLPFARGEGTRSIVRVVALLKPAPQYESFNQTYRYNSIEVQKYLMARSKASLAPVWAAIMSNPEGRNNIQFNKVHPINNAFSADVTREGLKFLTYTPNITKIYLNGKILYEKAVNPRRALAPPPAPAMPHNFVEMGLDKVILEMPKVTGAGVILGHMDSGVDGTHPALKGKIISFFNGETHKTSPPVDFESHGTHTAGTIVGGDRSSLMMGVAPGAKLISAGAVLDYDTMLEGMKWFADPDGNPLTKDFPRVISNSWNCQDAPDVELFYNAISAWEALGILPVFSAGNSGPDKATITKPHEHPASFTVGAAGMDGKVTRESSRGPAQFRSQIVQKPDLVAPGEDINSAAPGGGFELMGGTSAATPHVSGAIALLLQLKPDLTPVQIRTLLTKTAETAPAGSSPGSWNPNYGFGKLDIYKAVKGLVALNRQMLGIDQNQRFSFSSNLMSPADQELKVFVDGTDKDQAFAPFPKESNGSTWVTAEEAFN